MNVYDPQKCAVFFKTREEYGELSNMANYFPLNWNGLSVGSSEALYQAHKFSKDQTYYDIDLGRVIKPFEVVISQKNSMVSKMKAKKYRSVIRQEWDDIKLDVMNYCLTLKYLQHRDILDEVLDNTLDMDIVEKSRKDQLWGAVNDYNGNLVGNNILGCLWMIIRESRPNILPLDKQLLFL